MSGKLAMQSEGGISARFCSFLEAIQSLYLGSGNRTRDRQIAARITTLHRVALEEGKQIDPASLAQFAEFFLANPELAIPKITMTSEGHLRARWIKDKDDFAAIEFTGSPSVKLVAEIPRNTGSTATYFANESIDNVLSAGRAIGAFFGGRN